MMTKIFSKKPSPENKRALEMKIQFSKEILDQFRKDVGSMPPETGGMIGCSGDAAKIDLYVFDKSSTNTSVSFDYDAEALTRVYKTWKSAGGQAVGFIHSHPSGYTQPSYDDVSMALTLMRFFKTSFFYMPIIQSNQQGFYHLYFYVLRIQENQIVQTLEYVVKATTDGYTFASPNPKAKVYSIAKLESYYGPAQEAADKNRPKPADKASKEKPSYTEQKLFVRLKGVYPEKVLNKTVVMVGCGGGRTIVENLARQGFRNFVLVDGDTVAPSNVSTQGVFISEIGKKKVFAIRDRIRDINPSAKVLCIDRFLNDSVCDEEFVGWLKAFHGAYPTDYLLLGCTDSFKAQKRLALLSLKYSIPYVAASVYERGLAAEAIFVYPGVTRSCPRCMLRSRYEAYENGYQNQVTSAGCPTFATERLNTAMGFISIMMLMYKSSPGSPYNDMLEKVADRNFVWIRMSPYLGDSDLQIRLFDQVLDPKYAFFDETLWIPQHPDSAEYGEEPCKLCGGTGNLLTLKEKWADTRKAQ